MSENKRPHLQRMCFSLTMLVLLSLSLCMSRLWGNSDDSEVIFDDFSKIQGARQYEELRGVWISTVGNIDWPLKNGTEEEQKKLLLFYLDKVVEQNMNAVFFQAKPTGGTMYPSKLAPFAAEFTGEEEIENPYKTDFLEFLIQQAHQRNIEVHVWVNPYRIATHTDKSRLSAKNFGLIYEGLDAEGNPATENDGNRLISYGGRMYLDPGRAISQDYVLLIITEILTNYDVDAIHFDDYFYQYAVSGQVWPDHDTLRRSKTGKKYDATSEEGSNDKKGIAYWRRENTNRLVERIQKEIKAIKPYVKWGISPFGVWRNSRPSPSGNLPVDEEGSDTRAGSTSYDSLYADARLWLRQGGKYVDYLVPQVYWTRHLEYANYDTITEWWAQEARRSGVKSALYIGHALYKAGGDDQKEPWKSAETMSKQIEFNRAKSRRKEVVGSVFFTVHDLIETSPHQDNSMGAKMMQDVRQRMYQIPSLIPKINAMKDQTAPPAVKNLAATPLPEGGLRLTWQDPSTWKVDRYGHLTSVPGRYYVVYRLRDGEEVEILQKLWRQPHSYNIQFIDKTADPGHYTYAVSSLDRLHNQSKLTEIKVHVPVMIGSDNFSS